MSRHTCNSVAFQTGLPLGLAHALFSNYAKTSALPSRLMLAFSSTLAGSLLVSQPCDRALRLPGSNNPTTLGLLLAGVQDSLA